jgi:PAS domain S-box-containing protein
MTAAAHRPHRTASDSAHALADAVPHLVWLAGPDGGVEYLNRACREYLGWPMDDVLGADWRRAVHPDDLPRTAGLWEAAVRAGSEFEAEYRLRRHDGEYRWHLGRARPQRAAGAVARWFGTCTDVHDRKAAEDALRKGEARLRAIVEKSFDAVELIAPDGTVLYASPSVVRVGGRTAEGVVGRSAFEWCHPDDAAALAAAHQQFVREPGASLSGEYRYRHEDGSWRWAEAACTNLLHDPDVGAIVVNFHDVTERKEAEAARRRAESTMRLVWEHAANGIRMTDAAGTVVAANPAYCRLVGLPREEVEGRPMADAYAPARRPTILSDYGRRFAARAVEPQYEAEVEMWDGRRRWFEVANAHLDTPGEAPLLISIFRDVTDRKRGEAELRESERQYRLLFQANPHPMWVYDPRTLRFLDVNAAAVARYGYSREEFLGMMLADIRPPEDVPALLQALGRSAGDSDGLWRHRRKDGAVRDVEVVGHEICYGGRPARLALAADVTDRVAAERALREREALLRGIIDNIPCRVFWKDRDSVFLGCNELFARDHGLPGPEAVVGRTDLTLGTPPAQGEAFRARDRAVMESGEPQTNVEEPLTLPGGASVTLLTSKVPLRDAGGAVVGVLGVYQDITARKRLEEQYRQAQKMEAVGRLAGGIAHDFNNLLTVINGYSDVVLAALHAADPARVMVEEVRKAGERAAALTRQLLAFGRKQLLRHKVLDLGSVVGDSANLLGRLIGGGVELVVRTAADLPRVKADPVQIEQVLLNLAVNARDAMPGGGRLTIETRAAALPGGRAEDGSDIRPGPYAMVAVSDTGCGMTDEVRAHVFEPFYTTKGQGKGTGLGLATVYGIVKQSGGHVEVESAPGRGATFRVYLPAIGAAGPQERAPAAGALPRGTETVLIAEDEEGVRGVAELALRHLGYAVLSAAGAEEAEALARGAGRIDLLLTDVVMPGAGGRELAQRLRAGWPGLRVLYTSGYAEDALARHGVECDGVDLLRKPFTPATLARRVREVLDRSE